MAIQTIIIGRVDIETIIDASGKATISVAGGSCLYAAAGFGLWGKTAGLAAKIGEYIPLDFLNTYKKHGFDCVGIRKTVGDIDQIRFYAVGDDALKIYTDNPKKYFYQIKQPFPKELLGYVSQTNSLDSKRTAKPYSIAPEDLPEDYLHAYNLLLSSTDFVTNSLLPPFFRSQTNGHVILCGSDGFMQPSFWFEFPPLVRGCDVFLGTENQLETLFKGKSFDRWDMLKFICQSGVKIASCMDKQNTVFVFDAENNRKFEIPAYNVERRNPIGAFHVFCGGFAAGYFTDYDSLNAGLMGAVAASVKCEGSTPSYVLNTLPELAQNRIRYLKDKIKHHG